MKTRIPESLAAALTFALALGACSGAATEDKNGQAEQPVAEHTASRWVEKLDKNGNGKLELSELPEHKRKWLAAADTDGDGILSPEELRAHRTQHMKRGFAKMDKNQDGFITQDEIGERFFSKLAVADADKDGKLSQAELEKAHADGTLRGPRGFHGKRGDHERGEFGKRRGFGGKMDPQKLIEKLDTNGDGVLELSELPEHAKERLSAADTDGDQRLSAEELRTHFEARKGKRREQSR
jgi:Ca2+-binding EF-hand superfamily protein